MLYNQVLWERFVKKVEEDFELKTYPQLDPYFDFPKQKELLHNLVSDTTGKSVAKHSFLPLIKILIKTPRYRYQEDDNLYELETKIRPILFASHFDTYLYSFYSHALTEKYQAYIKSKGFDQCVLAYRTDLDGKCNIQFAKEVFDQTRNYGSCTAILLDIKGYFDSIDHNILKQKWCKILQINQLPEDQYKIYCSLTRYSYINKNSILRHFNINLNKKKKNNEYWQTLLDLIPDDIAGKSFKQKLDLLREKNLIVSNNSYELSKEGKKRFYGIPQGTAISALLSNIYLIDFDRYLFRLTQKEGFIYRRYCDDLLIICPPEKTHQIYQKVKKKIKEYHLIIQDRKTEFIDFRPNSKGEILSFDRRKIDEQKVNLTEENEKTYLKNLQYLGFEFNGQNIYIRASSLSRYFRKMKGRIVKTIIMAYSQKSKSDKIFKQQLFHRYSHLGKRNFLTYAYNSSKKYYINSKGIRKEGMNSYSIRRQLSAHFDIIKYELKKTNEQRAEQKAKKGKLRSIKS